MALFDNLFGAPPEYLTGLLQPEQTEKLRNQALTTGLVNSAIALIAQPRNQRYGSALPYIGKALMAGQQAGQNVYANALQGLETQQKLAELKRQQEQRAAQQQYAQTLPENIRGAAMAYPEVASEYAKSLTKTPERKTQVVGNRIVDISTGDVVYEAPTEAKARATKEVDAGNKILIVDSSTGETVREIPKGLAPQAPKAPERINYTVQTDANGNAVYVPNVPGAPVLDITGKPTTYKPAPTAAEAKVQEKKAQAEKLPKLITEAETYIKGATGSYLGTALDVAGKTVGYSTPGAQNIARLKGIEANLVLNMPRLEGPQSNLDQQLYREAAGQIGDPTVPNETKLAALDTIKNINKNYANVPVEDNKPILPKDALMPTAKPMPKVGEVKNGYVFKGGNPNDPKSWIKKGK